MKYFIIIIIGLINSPSFTQCNCKTLIRTDGTVIQCPPQMVSSDKETEIGLAVASNGVSEYLTLTIRFNSVANEVSGEITFWLENGEYFSLPFVNGGLSYIDGSQMAQAVFSLESLPKAKLKNSNIKTIGFKLSDGLRRSYQVTSNPDIIKNQLNCF